MSAQSFVFLSHNSADKPAVFEIAGRLRAAGIEPWLDAWHLVPGEKWQPALESALGDVRASLVFFGPSGVGPWQDEEMRVAIARRVGDPSYRVIPVLLPGALPPFLASGAWIAYQRSLDEEQPRANDARENQRHPSAPPKRVKRQSSPHVLSCRSISRRPLRRRPPPVRLPAGDPAAQPREIHPPAPAAHPAATPHLSQHPGNPHR